jgi:hypothetical protein
MTYRGHVENGIVRLDDGIMLPEGIEVRVETLSPPSAQPAEKDGPTLYGQMEPLVGIAKGLPPDLAKNHDHYLHGAPKR